MLVIVLQDYLFPKAKKIKTSEKLRNYQEITELSAYQSTSLWETAPARVAPAVICLVSSIGWPISLVMQDPHRMSARFRVG